MKSNCCNAPMSVGGEGTGEGATHFYVCEGCKKPCDPTASPINKGIAKTVELLQNCGFNTTDSGDGKTYDFSCDLPIPYVHMTVQKRFCLLETDRLYAVLQNNGIDDLEDKIQMTYDPHTETCIISLFNIILK